MRALLAVIAGYLIFAGSAVLFFRLLNVDPHSPAAAGFEGADHSLWPCLFLAQRICRGQTCSPDGSSLWNRFGARDRTGRDCLHHCAARRGRALEADCRSASVCPGIARWGLGPQKGAAHFVRQPNSLVTTASWVRFCDGRCPSSHG